MKKLIPIVVLSLAGCTVGPSYHPHDEAVPNSYSGLPADKDQAPLSAPVAGEADLSRWWLQFGDAELQKLITRALQSNLDLLTAASRVREARQQEIIAGAASLPQIDANGLTAAGHSGSKIVSKVGANLSTLGAASPSAPFDLSLYSAGFDATWELDLFGGTRRSIEAAQASSEATVWQMRDGEVALTAEIATDYIILRATQERIAILRAETKAQQDLLQVMKAREGVGFVTQLDVNQQSSLADTTIAEIPELEGNVRALEHAIAVLTAERPDATMAELNDNGGALPSMPSSLPVGLPSDLLRRRPDVRVAERELGAATAQVGVAVSDLYPKFNLIGAAGLAGGSVGNLAAGGNLAELGLGSITWPVFHWGQSQANVRAKEEEAKQAYYAYQKAVLSAVENVEDGLARYTTEQQRLVALERAEAAAKSSTAIATQQFRVGTVTYVNVLVAEATELSVRDQLVQSRQVFATDLISVYKALGGGWTADADGPTLQDKIVDDLSANPLVGASGSTLALRPGPVRSTNDDGVPAQLPPSSKSMNVINIQSSLRSPSINGEAKGEPQLQLGAWHSQDAAMAGWNRAMHQAGELLKGLTPSIVAADLPGKGRFYRLRTRAGSGADAIRLCRALSEKGLACILAPN